jgi:hypothetical protein
MRLPVGTKVVMSERGKAKWKDNNNNPHNVEGTITSFDEEEYGWGFAQFQEGLFDEEDYFPFSVDWDNGRHNVYRYGDLDPAVDFTVKSLEDYL